MSEVEDNLKLIGRYLAGESDAEQTRLLGERLKADPTLRADFLAYARVDSSLNILCAFSPTPPERSHALDPAAASKLGGLQTNRGRLLALAACLLCTLALIWLARPHHGAPFVTLVTSTQARWADPNIDLALRAGDLPTGLLRLEEGHVELATRAGARVFLQAPVAVRFDSRKRIFCESGRLVCECPTPASRLEAPTHQTLVVDLGTIFFCRCNAGLCNTRCRAAWRGRTPRDRIQTNPRGGKSRCSQRRGAH